MIWQPGSVAFIIRSLSQCKGWPSVLQVVGRVPFQHLSIQRGALCIYSADCCGGNMDLTTLDFIRIAIGVVILLYVANCLLNQKVWIRKTFSWGTKEEYPKIFQMNIIGGTLIGLFLVASPFLWWLPIASTNNWIWISCKGLSDDTLYYSWQYNGLSVGQCSH